MDLQQIAASLQERGIPVDHIVEANGLQDGAIYLTAWTHIQVAERLMGLVTENRRGNLVFHPQRDNIEQVFTDILDKVSLNELCPRRLTYEEFIKPRDANHIAPDHRPN